MLWVGSQVGTIYSINVLFLFNNSGGNRDEEETHICRVCNCTVPLTH